MSLLVVGSGGFIGKSILNLFPNAIGIGRGDRLPLDQEFDLVINCAGKVHSTLLGEYYKDNIVVLHELLTKLTYKKFIHLGSSSEYGRLNVPRKESMNVLPETDYEVSKCIGTQLCLSFRNVYVARPFCVYGKNDNPNKFIPTIIKRILHGEVLFSYKGTHDYVYIDDFISGLLTLSKYSGDKRIFNFGSGKAVSNREIIELLLGISGKSNAVVNYDNRYRSYDVDNWVSDQTNTYKELNWRAVTSIEEGLRLCF